MIDPVEQLTADKSQTDLRRDVRRVLNELPMREQQERNILLDSASEAEEDATPAIGARRLELWGRYAAFIAVAVVAAGVVMWLMVH